MDRSLYARSWPRTRRQRVADAVMLVVEGVALVSGIAGICVIFLMLWGLA